MVNAAYRLVLLARDFQHSPMIRHLHKTCLEGLPLNNFYQDATCKMDWHVLVLILLFICCCLEMLYVDLSPIIILVCGIISFI